MTETDGKISGKEDMHQTQKEYFNDKKYHFLLLNLLGPSLKHVSMYKIPEQGPEYPGW